MAGVMSSMATPWAAGRRLDRRVGAALLVSLLIHALLLSFGFGGDGSGLPGFHLPWRDRRVEAPAFRVSVLPTPTPPTASHAVVAVEPGMSPPASPGALPAAGEPGLPRRAPIAKPAPPPNRESTTAAVPLPEVAVPVLPQPAPATDLDALPAPGPAAPAAVPTESMIALARSDDPAWWVPLAQLKPLPASVVARPSAPTEVAVPSVPPAPADAPASGPASAPLPALAPVPASASASSPSPSPSPAAAQASLVASAAASVAARAPFVASAAASVAAAATAASAPPLEDAARQVADRTETERREAVKSEAWRQEAAKEAARQEAAKQQEAAREDAARQEASRRESARQEAAAREAARQESERLASAAQAATQNEDAKREARLQALGRAMKDDADRREAPARGVPGARPLDRPVLPPSPSPSPTRRGRLFGRTDANAELVLYAEAWARRIQLNPTLAIVRDAATRPHVDPLVTVAIRRDGSVESVTFVLSSGVPEIDDAVRRIVQGLAPYAAFSPALASDYDVIEIRRTWYFDVAVRLY